MSLHQLKAQQPPRMVPRSFFEHALPLLLETRADGFRALGARFCFELAGEGGGAWTLDCGQASVDPHAGRADVALRMSAARFEQLMAGRLDVRQASAAGDIVIDGDRALLARLAPLLAPMRTTSDPDPTPPLERVLSRH